MLIESTHDTQTDMDTHMIIHTGHTSAQKTSTRHTHTNPYVKAYLHLQQFDSCSSPTHPQCTHIPHIHIIAHTHTHILSLSRTHTHTYLRNNISPSLACNSASCFCLLLLSISKVPPSVESSFLNFSISSSLPSLSKRSSVISFIFSRTYEERKGRIGVYLTKKVTLDAIHSVYNRLKFLFLCTTGRMERYCGIE